jgi:hypothetical protein
VRKLTKAYVLIITLLLIAGVGGAIRRNWQVTNNQYQEHLIPLGQSAALYRAHQLEVQHVSLAPKFSQYLTAEERHIEKDMTPSPYIAVSVQTTYRKGDHILLNVDQGNTYEVSIGTRRTKSGMMYIFKLTQGFGNPRKKHTLRLSIDNPDLPHHVRNVFLLN